MDLVLLLITLIAGTLLIRWWPALRFVASFKTPPGGVLRDAEFNYAQIRLLPRWKPASLLNEGASLQATDPLGHRYLVVISEAREDFHESLDVGEHARLTLDRLIGSLDVLKFSGPESALVGGFPAVQYEIEGFHERTCVTYLHTTIAGNRAFHQVIAWATCSKSPIGRSSRSCSTDSARCRGRRRARGAPSQHRPRRRTIRGASVH